MCLMINKRMFTCDVDDDDDDDDDDDCHVSEQTC
jgi:hypothetical protein